MENNYGLIPNSNENGAGKKTPKWVKIGVFAGLIIILVLGILLPMKYVPSALSSLASSITSVFIPKEKTRIVSPVGEIKSGESFNISWTGKHRIDGSYSVTLECLSGTTAKSSVNIPDGEIVCGVPYFFNSPENSVDLTINTSKNRYTDVRIIVGFLPEDSADIVYISESIVTITNPAIAQSDELFGIESPSATAEASPIVSATPTTAIEPVATKPKTVSTQTYSGPADLTITVIGSGYIDSNTGKFVSAKSVNPKDHLSAVKFQIANQGGMPASGWSFRADLPSTSDSLYESGIQQTLYSGDKIEYVLSFENLTANKDNYATITVDTANKVSESKENNNTTKILIVNDNSNGVVINASGKTDLSVTILETGIMSNGKFVKANASSGNDWAAIKFEVQNLGDKETGEWLLKAELPISDQTKNPYTPTMQSSLKPGEKATFVISYDFPNYGTNTAKIILDPNNTLTESNETNNSASVQMVRN